MCKQLYAWTRVHGFTFDNSENYRNYQVFGMKNLFHANLL